MAVILSHEVLDAMPYGIQKRPCPMRLSWRRFSSILAIVLIGVTLAACGGSGSATAPQYVDRAEAFVAAGDFASAIIEYRNALRLANDPATRGQLGLAYTRAGRPQEGAVHLQRALEDGADPRQFALPLAKLLFDAGDSHGVARIPEAPGLNDEDRARLLAYRALALFEVGDLLAGRALLADAREASADLAEVYLGQAYEAVSDGEVNSAMTATLAAIAADDSFGAAWALKADLARFEGDREMAADALDRAVDLRPRRIAERLKRGSLNVELRNFDAAKSDADFLLQHAPDHPAGHFLRGLLHFEQGEKDGARTHFQEALARSPRYRAPMLYLAAIHLSQGNRSQAQHLIQRHAALGERTAESYRLEALLLVGEGQVPVARDLLTDAVKRRPGLSPALDPYLAALHIDLGDHDVGVELFRQALARQPESQASRSFLTAALVSSGDFKGAAEVVAQDGADDTALRRTAEFALLVSALSSGNYSEALKLASSIVDEWPDQVEGHMFKGAALIGLGRRDEAREAFAAAIDLDPDSSQPYLVLARLDWERGDGTRAIATLERARALHAQDPLVLFALADIRFAQTEYKKAEALLTELVAVRPEDATVRVWLAKSRIALGDREGAWTALRSALALDPEHAEARLLLSAQLGLEGELKEARELFAPLRETAPGAPEVLAQEGWFRMQEGDYEGAAEHYGRALARRADRSWTTQLFLARWRAGNHDASVATLEDWLSDHPEDNEIRHLLANALMQSENESRSIAVYRDLLASDGDDVIALNNLAWLLRNADPESALELSHRAKLLAPEDQNVLHTFGVLLLAKGDIEGAVTNLAQAYGDGQSRPEIGVNLARALWERGDLDRARALLQQLLLTHDDFAAREQAKTMLNALSELD